MRKSMLFGLLPFQLASLALVAAPAAFAASRASLQSDAAHAAALEAADDMAYRIMLDVAQGKRMPPAPPPGTKRADECAAGLEAFQQTTHRVIRERCRHCHEVGPGPNHSVADPAVAYERVLGYVNFNDLDNSLFVTYGGNMHCLLRYHVDCQTDEAAIKASLEEWWAAGESTCPRQGVHFTAEFAMPSDLPTREQGFKTMRFPLAGIDPAFGSAYLEVEAQLFAPDTEAGRGAYRFRKPRIVTSAMALRVRDVKILINGNFDPLANAFTSVDQIVAPAPMPNGTAPATHPVLSAKTLIALKGGMGIDDRIKISFMELAQATPRACNELETFRSRVMPVLSARDCYACHAGGAADEDGIAAARARFPMNVSDANLCAAFLERTDRANPAASVAIEYALRGRGDHPRVIPYVSEIVPAYAAWADAELHQTP